MPTLYWKNVGADNLWDNVNNWFEDDACTVAASAVPWIADNTYKTWDLTRSTDSITAGDFIYFNNGSNQIGGSFTVTGICDIGYISDGAYGTLDFSNGTINNGTFSGNAVYLNGIYVTGGNFTGVNCYNGGTINGGTFSGDGFSNYGNIYQGIFSGSGFGNYGTVFECTCSGAYASNYGTILGGTYTGNNFYNQFGGLLGAGVFAGAAFINAGDIYGGIFNTSDFTNNNGILGGIFCGPDFDNTSGTIFTGAPYCTSKLFITSGNLTIEDYGIINCKFSVTGGTVSSGPAIGNCYADLNSDILGAGLI